MLSTSTAIIIANSRRKENVIYHLFGIKVTELLTYPPLDTASLLLVVATATVATGAAITAATTVVFPIVTQSFSSLHH